MEKRLGDTPMEFPGQIVSLTATWTTLCLPYQVQEAIGQQSIIVQQHEDAPRLMMSYKSEDHTIDHY